MADFLLELRSEEIPARMQKGARAELEKLFRREMDAAGVATGDLTVWSTPRRLALIARDLPTETEAVRDEAKGPPVGAPDQAVDGFCRKNGVTRDQLEERDVKGRATYFAVIEKPGQAVSDLLAAAIPAIIRDFSWPKSMRWGEASISTESLKWVRPLSGIVALLDGEVVPCVMDGLASGRATVGHRFHSSGEIEIAGADDYADTLRDAHVIVDHEVRAGIIREGTHKAAKAAGLSVVEDEGLVVENAGLTEWPVPLLGRFDESYLDVPPEVIQLTARVNQKYFVCEQREPDGSSKLANAFICTSNIAAVDPAVVVDGNRKVLAARLSDARFFWELDQKTTLAEHAQKLERLTFLGTTTTAQKATRVANLAKAIVDMTKGLNTDPELAFSAGGLCKADLVTEMVGEFPELQGVMGGYYAKKQGLQAELACAIRDHYRPQGPSDDVPTAPLTVAVALADKIDTLANFFYAGERPTGSKDPYALRRAMFGVISLVLENDLRISIRNFFDRALNAIYDEQMKSKLYAHKYSTQEEEWFVRGSYDPQGRESGLNLRKFIEEKFGSKHRALLESDFSSTDKWETRFRHRAADGLREFLNDRLFYVLRDRGIRYDVLQAALNSNFGIVETAALSSVLQSFVETDNGTNLLAGYKRAANILKKEEWSGGEAKDLSYSPEPAEKALIDALGDAAPKAAAAVQAEEFENAMAALATLRAPIDAFFDEVTVNDDNEDKREYRLALLARFRDAVHTVADFSRIEG